MSRRITTRPAAIVTGASHGIGQAISKTVLSLGYEVYGFGRHFEAQKYSRDNSEDLTRSDAQASPSHFHPVEGDLLDTDWLTEEVKKIMKAEPEIRVLVNNAGCAWYGLHEELNAKEISAMVRTNLELPMVLTQMLLRRLKASQGYVINIASVTANEAAPRGAAYGATKAGLLSFSRSLFAENRKYDLKVSCILPDLTDTDLYRNADFKPSEDPGYSLDPQDVSGAVRYILTQPEGVVIPELMLRPQKNRIIRRSFNSLDHRCS